MGVWQWSPREHRFEEPTSDISSWTLVAADSWFVKDRRVRAFDRHRARFAHAAAEVGIGEAVTDDFWAAMVEKIPATGEWFPRVDVLENSPVRARVVAFRMRQAPKRTQELRVLIPPYSDPRNSPGRKGPDIALLSRLAAEAIEDHDCGELLLLSEDGYVIEGATTSLPWWVGETLHVPDPKLGALPGVTSAVILDEARELSIPIEYHRTRSEDLAEHEVWLVNALHGIRRAKEFVNGRTDERHLVRQLAAKADVESVQLDRWRDWLDSISVPRGA